MVSDKACQLRVDNSQAISAAGIKQTMPFGKAHAVGAGRGKVCGRGVKLRQRRADRARLRRGWVADRDAGEEFDQRQRLFAAHPIERAIAIMDRAGDRTALGGEVIEQ